MNKTLIKTLQFKVRNPKKSFLEVCALEVNQIWNYANDISSKAIRKYVGKSTYLSYYDLQKLASGCIFSANNPNGFTHINTGVVQFACQEYVTRRIQFKKSKLRWRTSHGSRKSLGWVPLKQENISIYLKEMKEHQFTTLHSDKENSEKISLKPKKGTRLAGKGYDPSKLLQFDFSHLSSNPSLKKGEEKPQLYIKILREVFQIFNEQYLKFHLVDLKGVMKSGNLSQDSLGDWYLNLAVELDSALYQTEYLQKHKKVFPVAPHESVGIDPNSKQESYLALSTGEKIESSGFYRKSEEKLGKAQSNGHKKQAKRLNRKIKRQRNHEINLISSRIVRDFQVIKIGDLRVQSLVMRRKKKQSKQQQASQASKPGSLKSTNKSKQKYIGPRMGKSLLDNGIGLLRTQLSYKSHWAGRSFYVVSERNTTRVCSNCGQFTGPKGLRELGIRVWTCSGCGTIHDRDINSGKNVDKVSVFSNLLSKAKAKKKKTLSVSPESNSRPGLGVIKDDRNDFTT